MSLFDELETILSKAKAQTPEPENTAKDEPDIAPLAVPGTVASQESVAVSPLSVPVAPIATEVEPTPTVSSAIPTLAPRPALDLNPGIALAEPATVSEPAAVVPPLPSRPSLDSVPKLSLAIEEPESTEKEDEEKTVEEPVNASPAVPVKSSGLPPRPDTLVAAENTKDEGWSPVALPTEDSLVVASAPILAAKAESVSSDPQNYIAAVSHAEDVTVRTNALPEIKPAGNEFFFEKDEEPVVF